MVDVALVSQGDQRVDIQKIIHGKSTIAARTCALDTIGAFAGA
jgi:hypothetical protein